MKTMTIAAVMTAATFGILAAEPAAAQNRGDRDRNDRGRSGYSEQYEEGYRAGYRAGYETSRTRRTYDDRVPAMAVNSGPSRDRSDRWSKRYSRTYTYNDDTYYRECRTQADPAGVIVGALIGGLLGNQAASGGSRGVATAAGVIIGGTLGATLTKDLNCEDKSYAYKTYYDGFNSGRPNSNWEWRNPKTNRRGAFRVGDYYNDPDGFRCATYSQTIYIQNRPQETRGRACQQPDGTWAIVG